MNRYYNSRLGRFMSPDPMGIASARLGNPQSLHRYAYVLNNPLIGIDPRGLECVYISDDGSSVEELDPTSQDWDSAECAQSGGTYFNGNNEVNWNNWKMDNGSWGNFDFDKDSNWVGLANDYGTLQQAACLGSGSDCALSSLADMGQDYQRFVTDDPDMEYVSNSRMLAFHVTASLDYKLNGLSCEFMSVGVSTGNDAKVTAEWVSGFGSTGGGLGLMFGIEKLAKSGGALTLVGGGYAALGKTYASFWKGMSYLGGCKAYGGR